MVTLDKLDKIADQFPIGDDHGFVLPKDLLLSNIGCISSIQRNGKAKAFTVTDGDKKILKIVENLNSHEIENLKSRLEAKLYL